MERMEEGEVHPFVSGPELGKVVSGPSPLTHQVSSFLHHLHPNRNEKKNIKAALNPY